MLKFRFKNSFPSFKVHHKIVDKNRHIFVPLDGSISTLNKCLYVMSPRRYCEHLWWMVL